MIPLVSIIIPTYNRAYLIKETLDSILLQTYTNWECIVVDDGSNDGTDNLLAGYIEKDHRFKYFSRPKNRLKGANSCRNYGFEVSSGDYINWFDSDDIMHPNKLKIQINQLIVSELNYSVCQTLVFKNTIDNIIGLRSENIYSDNIFEDYLERKVIWMTPSAIWKKEFLNQFNFLFDEELQAAQEWEFHCRMLYHSDKYELVDDALIYIRNHEQSISYNSSMNKRMFNYFLARFKIYNNEEIKLNQRSKKHLQLYLISTFKDFVRSKNINEAFKAFYIYILTENKFSLMTKLASFFGIFSYYIFGKGGVLLKNVKY